MLYKNNEKYEIKKGDIDEIHEFIGGKLGDEEKIKFLKINVIGKKWNEKNKIYDAPEVFIECKENVVEGSSTKISDNVWIYCENVTLDENGKNIYLPSNKKVKDGMLLTKNDIDFIFFLVHCSRNLKDGKNTQKSRYNLIEFDNQIKRQKLRVESKKIKHKVENIIFSTKEEDLKKYAKSMFIKNVDSMDLYEVQDALSILLVDSKNVDKNKINRFVSLTNADDKIEMRTLVQDAIEAEIIKFVHAPNVRKWHYLNEQQERGESICQVPRGEVPEEFLSEYLFEHEDVRELLKITLKDKV